MGTDFVRYAEIAVRLVFWAVIFCVAARSISRRAGTPDERHGCDRRANLLSKRGAAREGYAQVSFLGAHVAMFRNGALYRAQKDTAR